MALHVPFHFARELAQEPVLRELPVAHYGLRRDLEDLSSLVDGQPAEVSQLDHPRLPLVDHGQRFQCIVERDEIVWRRGRLDFRRT